MLFRTLNLSAYVAGSMRVAASMREVGPYAVIALIVPGGCLIALAIWAFRNRASLMRRVRQWQELRRSAGRQLDPTRAQRPNHESGSELNRMRLDRITEMCETAHSWYGPPLFAQPVSAMVFLRAGSAAESQPQKRHEDAGPCVRA